MKEKKKNNSTGEDDSETKKKKSLLDLMSVRYLKAFKANSKSHADLMDSLYDPAIWAWCPFSSSKRFNQFKHV